MLKRKLRISEKEYQGLWSKKGVFFSTEFLSVKSSKLENQSVKISFLVSKKSLNKAVDRNKLKRRGYSVIGEFIPRIKEGSALFFNLKKGCFGLNYLDFKAKISESLIKIGMIEK